MICHCGKEAKAKGLCGQHYSQQYRAKQLHGTPTDVEPVRVLTCTECGKAARARGLCLTHYQRWRRACTGKGRRLSAGVCIDDKPHAWGDGACRICGVARPIGWA